MTFDRNICSVNIGQLIRKVKLDAWPYIYPLIGQPDDFPELQVDSPIFHELLRKRELLIRFQYLFCAELCEIQREISEDREYTEKEMECLEKRMDNCEYRKPFSDALDDMRDALNPIMEKYRPRAEAGYQERRRANSSEA